MPEETHHRLPGVCARCRCWIDRTEGVCLDCFIDGWRVQLVRIGSDEGPCWHRLRGGANPDDWFCKACGCVVSPAHEPHASAEQIGASDDH